MESKKKLLKAEDHILHRFQDPRSAAEALTQQKERPRLTYNPLVSVGPSA